MSVASFVSQPFSPAERATITCWIGYWVGLRAGLVECLQAEAAYNWRKAKDEKARLRGDDKWMLPSVICAVYIIKTDITRE